MSFYQSSQVQDGPDQIFIRQKLQKLIGQKNFVEETSCQNKQFLDLEQKQSNWSLPFIKILPVILTLCLSGFYFGYICVHLGAVKIEEVIKYYGITMSESLSMGILNGVVSIGGGLGCLLTSVFLDKFSRKNSLLITGYIAFVSGSILFVPNQVVLIIMRLIQGTCIGLYCTIVPMYIREISPLHLAGTFGVLFQFFMALGSVFCFILSYLLKIITEDIGLESSWQGVFAFPLFPLLTQILLINFKYPFETPKYLILNNRQSQLPQLLRNFYFEQSLEKVAEKLKNNILKDKNKDESNIHQEIKQQIISDTSRSIEKSNVEAQKVQKTPTIAFVTACFMSFSQQMVGLGCIVIYGSQLVGQRLPQLANQSGIIINAPQLVSSLLLSYLLSKYNRKLILQCGMVALALIDVMIGMAFLNSDSDQGDSKSTGLGYVILAGQFMYNAVYAISVGSMLWIFLPALIQPSLIPVASFMNWVSSAIVLIVFPLLKDELPNQNPGWLFIFFAGYTLFCFVIYEKIVIEIKDKPQKQIFEEYERMKICQ